MLVIVDNLDRRTYSFAFPRKDPEKFQSAETTGMSMAGKMSFACASFKALFLAKKLRTDIEAIV